MISFRHVAAAFLMSSLWSSALAAQKTTLQVHLVYLKSGKPAEGERITLYLGEASRATTPKLEGTTSSYGVAIFQLADPLPKAVWVYTDNGHIEGCAVKGLIPLEEVVKHGVTVGADDQKGFRGGVCKGDRSLITRLAAKPGEIVVFVRKLSLRERIQN